MQKKKILFTIISLTSVLVISGCAYTSTSVTNESDTSENKVERTDYTIFHTEPILGTGGVDVYQYIVGLPVAEAETIKQNAYFVQWRIDFSQVQTTDMYPLDTGGCTNLEKQEVRIDGWIEMDLSQLGVEVDDLPNNGPVYPTGTVHETVTGTPGTWNCDNEAVTAVANSASAEYVQSVSGEHVASFSGVSNITGMTISGADIYLDLSDVQMIWPDAKIEYASEDTPIPLVPLTSDKL